MTPRVRNRAALESHGLTELRRLVLDVVDAGLAACDPGRAAERLVALEGDDLLVDGTRHRLHPGGRVVVLGSGKATLPIALALERVLGERVEGTIVVRDRDGAADPARVEVLEAAHPLPDERSAAAARRLLDEAGRLGERDLALACFTGGSSALTSLPPPGVPFGDKAELHRILLSAGIPIFEVNTVRKHASAFKGGRFAAAVTPARLINLTVSDVAGDRLDTLTDPSVDNASTAADAIGVLRAHRLWDQVPASVRSYLCGGEAELPDLSGAAIETTLLVSGVSVCAAMAAAARERGAEAVVHSTGLEGEATELGGGLAGLAAERAGGGDLTRGPTVLLGCGGEATVRLGPDGRIGTGGPNGEAALAAALRLDGAQVAAAFLDTDGSDGGTVLAGGLADGTSAARARASGLDIGASLAAHCSGEALLALDDGIETGPTHTNVNDLFVVAIGAG